MIRITAILATLLASTACGSQGGTGSTVPPSATATSSAGTTRLTLGSYCWSASNVTGCGDTGDPATLPALAVIRAATGETITIRLRFDPTGPVDVSIGTRNFQVDPARVLRIRVDRRGLLSIGADHGPDDVSYYARIRLPG
jgi:hypothetical protein